MMKPITPYQEKVVVKLIKTGMDKAEKVLNHWLPIPIKITEINITSHIGSMSSISLINHGKEQFTMVEMEYYGALEGKCYILLPVQNAKELVALLTNRDYNVHQIDDVYTATIMETGIILAHGITSSFSNLMKQKINLKAPRFIQSDWNTFLLNNIDSADHYSLIIQWSYTISEYEIDGKILLPFDSNTTETMLDTIKSIS